MKHPCIFLLCISAIISCNQKKIPDVSGIKVNLQVQRFEKDFFSIDTNQVAVSLEKLHQAYPVFLKDFIFNILALPPQPDSAGAVENQVILFKRAYQSVADSSSKVFSNISEIETEVVQGLKFVKYYFPSYKLPSKLITFIGPFNSYGNILTTNALAVGLQLYLGKNFSIYQSEALQQLYPAYIARRFSKEYIAVNCMKNIVDDIFPDNSAGKPLVEQMIQAGKKLYLLDQFMPETADTLKTGYTASQLEGSLKNEAVIWSFFVQNDLLFITDPSLIKDYMNDAPKTQVFGEASPGFIGQFVGWQIVKKWMLKNQDVSLGALLHIDPKVIFDQAKYKP